MNYWYLWFIIIICVLLPAARARKLRQARIARKNRIKRQKGDHIMNELIKNYIGKEVIVYASSTSGVTGTVTKIEDNWVELEDKNGQKQIVNTDYVSRIQEYPRNKKGKKKLVVT